MSIPPPDRDPFESHNRFSPIATAIADANDFGERFFIYQRPYGEEGWMMHWNTSALNRYEWLASTLGFETYAPYEGIKETYLAASSDLATVATHQAAARILGHEQYSELQRLSETPGLSRQEAERRDEINEQYRAVVMGSIATRSYALTTRQQDDVTPHGSFATDRTKITGLGEYGDIDADVLFVSVPNNDAMRMLGIELLDGSVVDTVQHTEPLSDSLRSKLAGCFSGEELYKLIRFIGGYARIGEDIAAETAIIFSGLSRDEKEDVEFAQSLYNETLQRASSSRPAREMVAEYGFDMPDSSTIQQMRQVLGLAGA